MKLHIFLALFLLMGTASAIPAWPHDPMAVDVYDYDDTTLTINPTLGGTYILGLSGVDIPIALYTSDIYSGGPVNIEIWDSQFSPTGAGIQVTPILGGTVPADNPIHLDANTLPGIYHIVVDGFPTDDFQIALPAPQLPHGQVYDANDPFELGSPSPGASYAFGDVPFKVETDNSLITDDTLTFVVKDSNGDVVDTVTLLPTGSQTREFSVNIDSSNPVGSYEIYEQEGKVNNDHFQMYQQESVTAPEFPTIALPMLAIIGIAFIFMRRKE